MDLDTFIKEARDLVIEASTAAYAMATMTMGLVIGSVEQRWALHQRALGEPVREDDILAIREKLYKACGYTFTQDQLRQIDEYARRFQP